MRPTIRLVLVTTAGLAAALLPVLVSTRLWSAWVVFVSAVALAAGVDALLGMRKGSLSITVDLPPVLYVGDRDSLLLTFLVRGGGSATVEALPDLGADLEPQPSHRLRVAEGEPAEAAISLVPRRRGTAEVRAVWVRWTGPLGLVDRHLRHEVGAEIAVVPNVRAVREAAIRHFQSREFLAGTRVRRYLGEGSEFDSLREYMPGFDHRSIDWKASARHTRLLSREYRAERNHQMVLAFDTGHLMIEPVEGIPRLDHAVNAGLILAWAGLRSGDRVGLFAFDERVRLSRSPQGGPRTFAAIRASTARLAYSTGETNFTLGLMSLAGQLSRRTLVVLFTDFTDTVTAELMVENLSRLALRHLVIFVTLRDPEVLRLSDARLDTLVDLHRAAVADDLLRERELVLRRLRRLGLHCVDQPASLVSPTLIDRYLAIKQRELV
jgi:uncharacterized protein (DUF58 family)